jgi:hypothetical protein
VEAAAAEVLPADTGGVLPDYKTSPDNYIAVFMGASKGPHVFSSLFLYIK